MAKAALDVRLDGDTVWLSQKQMSELFDKNVRTVSEHLRNIGSSLISVGKNRVFLHRQLWFYSGFVGIYRS